MSSIPELWQLAVDSHRAGQIDRAEELYRHVLSCLPEHAEATHMMGVLMYQRGEFTSSIQWIERAIDLGAANELSFSNLGAALQQAGRLEEAQAYYERALVLQPDLPEAHNNLGNVFKAKGNLDRAIDEYRHALHLKPGFAEAHNNLGEAFRAQQRPAEAIACYRAALAAVPDFAEVHFSLAVILKEQDVLAESIVHFAEAVRLRPAWAEARFQLGAAQRLAGDLDGAAENLQEAIRRKADLVEAYYELGDVLYLKEQPGEAVLTLQKSLEIRPDSAAAYNNLGVILREMDRLEDSRSSFQRALELAPNSVDALSNLGAIMRELGHVYEAEEYCRRALVLSPDDCDVHCNLGATLTDQSRLQEAMASLDESLRHSPDCVEAHFNRSLVWLLQDNHLAGWSAYEWRWKRKKAPPLRRFLQPLWDGTSIPGQTILLHPEQGFGDTLQFVRFAALVRQRMTRVVLASPKQLARLLRRCPDVDEVITEGDPLPSFDTHAPLLSLPAILRISRQDEIPAKVPYLYVDAELVAGWQKLLGSESAFKIGIAWQGNPKNVRDRFRSIPLGAFEPLTKIPGVQVYSLQKGHGHEQLAGLDDPASIIDLDDRIDDFADTAACMSNLDLIITLESATAHLAGALGLPAWVPLSTAPDWRWLLDREDSPWYPTVRLFRQSKLGCWDDVFKRIVDELTRMLVSP